MRWKFRVYRLIVLTAASSLLLLMLRWSLDGLLVSNNASRFTVEREPTNATTRKPLTSWNLTCPDRQEGEEAATEVHPPTLPLEKAIPCYERTPRHRYERRGDFWVLYNYVPATETARCWETVTYTTHGDLSYLDNLGPLVRRWRAPISVALYAPGDDLETALRGVRWARACLEPPLVERHVSFHVLFDAAHVPDKVPAAADALSVGKLPNCSEDLSFWTGFTRDATYRRRQNLEYPANVARNVAREAALTHFVLVSDIDMYPSPGLAPAFLEMVRSDPELRKPGRRVFVVPPFSLQEGVSLPEDKSTLLQMLEDRSAAPFHETTCVFCHKIPSPQKWVCGPRRPNGSVSVYAVTRRVGWYSRWEPFYIGTHDEPLYDERLTWEGKRDKRLQGYAMCLMDYRFHALDNAFLVHRPGTEAPKTEMSRRKYIDKVNALLKSKIVPEYSKLYGKRKDCEV